MTAIASEAFWSIGPSHPDARADWDDGVVQETVYCPVDPMHQHPGRRLSDLKVVLPDRPPDDFSWTWMRDCLVADRIVGLLRNAGLTGFDLRPSVARYATLSQKPPRLWELVLSGWGGIADSASGIRLNREESCSVCGHLVYTPLVHPEKLIDKKSWDGSDFFLVWPLPLFPFVTTRAAKMIIENRLTGIELKPVSELKLKSESFSPGRLSYKMPEGRALALGKPLGIY